MTIFLYSMKDIPLIHKVGNENFVSWPTLISMIHIFYPFHDVLNPTATLKKIILFLVRHNVQISAYHTIKIPFQPNIPLHNETLK
jgi:hypothetical protein